MSQGRRKGRSPLPLVSVIVPAFNAEASLARTLRSVAGQTYSNFEIIIVDDGSSDGTAAVAEAFTLSEKRARLIRQPNRGVASARNRAISECRGEWIAPIDADDLWHPTKIEKQVSAAYAEAELPGFVYCWRRLIDSEDRVINSGGRWLLRGAAFKQLAYMNAVECGSSLLAWREAVLQAGGYDESLRAERAQGCEDMMLQLRIARAFPITVVPEHLVGWRLHETNMSSDFDQMARSCSLVFRRLRNDGAPVPPEAIRWVEARNAFDLAEQNALNKRYAATLRWLGTAIRGDPIGCGMLLLYRLLRSANRRFSRQTEPTRRPFFDEVDPAAPIDGDPHRLRSMSRLLKRLELRRIARLAVKDQGPGVKRRRNAVPELHG